MLGALQIHDAHRAILRLIWWGTPDPPPAEPSYKQARCRGQSALKLERRLGSIHLILDAGVLQAGA